MIFCKLNNNLFRIPLLKFKFKYYYTKTQSHDNLIAKTAMGPILNFYHDLPQKNGHGSDIIY